MGIRPQHPVLHHISDFGDQKKQFFFWGKMNINKKKYNIFLIKSG